jgi:hypothetical protein
MTGNTASGTVRNGEEKMDDRPDIGSGTPKDR